MLSGERFNTRMKTEATSLKSINRGSFIKRSRVFCEGAAKFLNIFR
jgi:hypothetical protein